MRMKRWKVKKENTSTHYSLSPYYYSVARAQSCYATGQYESAGHVKRACSMLQVASSCMLTSPLPLTIGQRLSQKRLQRLGTLQSAASDYHSLAAFASRGRQSILRAREARSSFGDLLGGRGDGLNEARQGRESVGKKSEAISKLMPQASISLYFYTPVCGRISMLLSIYARCRLRLRD